MGQGGRRGTSEETSVGGALTVVRGELRKVQVMT